MGKRDRKQFPFINTAVCAVAAISAYLAVLLLTHSDYKSHIKAAIRKIDGESSFFVNLYQYLVAFGIKFFQGEPVIVAAVVNGTLEVLYVAALSFILSKWLPSERPWYLRLLSICCVVFSSAPFFVFQGVFYRGISGINTWHNPTSYAIKPFIVMSFFLIVVLFDRASAAKEVEEVLPQKVFRKDGVVLFLALMASLYMMTYGKISGLAVLAPATLVMAVFWWGKSKWSAKRLIFCLKVAAMFIPALILFSLHYSMYFPDGGEAKAVYVGFSRLFSDETPMILLRTVWILMLPLFITLTRIRSIVRNKGFVLAWLVYIFAFFEHYMFQEIGPREGHGNTSWGRHYALVLLLVMSIVEINKDWHERKITSRIGFAIMLVYTISGLVFLLLLLTKGDYYI